MTRLSDPETAAAGCHKSYRTKIREALTNPALKLREQLPNVHFSYFVPFDSILPFYPVCVAVRGSACPAAVLPEPTRQPVMNR